MRQVVSEQASGLGKTLAMKFTCSTVSGKTYEAGQARTGFVAEITRGNYQVTCHPFFNCKSKKTERALLFV